MTVVHEERLLGTGGTILKNRAFLRMNPFSLHTQIISLFLTCQRSSHHFSRPRGAELTMMVFETLDPQSCGIVEIDEYDVVQAFHEKVSSPPGNLANAAVYLLEPFVVDMMANIGKEQTDFSTGVIPHLLGKILTYSNTCYHRDIGTLPSWIEANQDFPIIPATSQNAKAWATLMAKGDGDLEQVSSIVGFCLKLLSSLPYVL